jgi:hypothetical protein
MLVVVAMDMDGLVDEEVMCGLAEIAFNIIVAALVNGRQ